MRFFFSSWLYQFWYAHTWTLKTEHWRLNTRRCEIKTFGAIPKMTTQVEQKVMRPTHTYTQDGSRRVFETTFVKKQHRIKNNATKKLHSVSMIVMTIQLNARDGPSKLLDLSESIKNDELSWNASRKVLLWSGAFMARANEKKDSKDKNVNEESQVSGAVLSVTCSAPNANADAVVFCLWLQECRTQIDEYLNPAQFTCAR